MASHIERRKFLAALGGAAAEWPLAARAQQPAMPIVGLVNIRSADASARNAGAFRKGLNETGTVAGSAKTRSGLVWSPALPGRAATRPESTLSHKR